MEGIINLYFVLTFLLTCHSINANDIQYSKCLETRVYCQSLPPNCVQENSRCDTLLIASPVVNTSKGQDKVQFELFGRIDESKQKWFAMGLSSDQKMGNDSVTEIYVSSDGKHQEMRQSWNGIKPQNEILSPPVTGITQIGPVSNSDGILGAKWIRDAVTDVHSNRFDIINNKYNILLASGPTDADNSKQ